MGELICRIHQHDGKRWSKTKFMRNGRLSGWIDLYNSSTQENFSRRFDEEFADIGSCTELHVSKFYIYKEKQVNKFSERRKIFFIYTHKKSKSNILLTMDLQNDTCFCKKMRRENKPWFLKKNTWFGNLSTCFYSDKMN